jgi:hypothetical protein
MSSLWYCVLLIYEHLRYLPVDGQSLRFNLRLKIQFYMSTKRHKESN